MNDNGDAVCISLLETEETKTNVMQIYQIIRIFSNACDQKNASRIKQLYTNNKILQNVIPLKSVTKRTLSNPETQIPFRYDVIDLILHEIYEEYQDDYNELLFLASAKCELDRLQEVIVELKKDADHSSEIVNQTRYSDSAIIFALKYGNINNQHFLKCMRILIEADIDVNKFDINGKTAIDLIATLYECNKDRPEILETLKKIAQIILDRGIFKPDDEKTLKFLEIDMVIDQNYEFKRMDEKALLFYWISKSKTHDFLKYKNIKPFVDSDNGENTLLQLACKKSDKMISVVRFLLNNGADPNMATKRNPLTPLELAGTKNNQKIYEEILSNNKTRIEKEQFNNFVKCRSQSLKPKLFELLLESNNLEPKLTFETTGNTPLHYAILFSHKRAIQILLKRHLSLVVKNNFNVTPLDIIDAEDLEKYFDSCLALDNHTPDFSNPKYKMQLRFNCLLDQEKSEELKVVSKICKRPNIEHLLTHPFIHTFITLKWFRTKIYFWGIMIFQALIFLLLSFLFYRLPNATTFEYILCIFFALINIVLKILIFLCFNKYKRPVFSAFDRADFHGFLEILLVVTIIGSFFQIQCRAFVFPEMAISILLTAGYHPVLSKWSLMLQKVFKTFTVLLIFFSVIVAGFSLGFHILFPDDAFFKNFISATFRTFIMTTGEFNIEEDTGLDHAGLAGYLLFFLFAMSMSLVIVNFWTGVAVTDIERIEKHSEVNASKNVILFMLFVDYIYTNHYFSILRNCVRNPLLFLGVDKNYSSIPILEVDFFVNKEKQFGEKVGFPLKVNDECFNKIKCHYYKLTRVSSEKEMLTKLDEILKILAKK